MRALPRRLPAGPKSPLVSGANDPFPIEWVLKNGNLRLGDRTVVPAPSVCAATVVKSDGSKVYLFVDTNIKTLGSAFEVLTSVQIPTWPL